MRPRRAAARSPKGNPMNVSWQTELVRLVRDFLQVDEKLEAARLKLQMKRDALKVFRNLMVALFYKAE